MKTKSRQSGLTLMEMTVVITVVALLTTLSMPAIRTFFNSIATSSGTRSLISAGLASARAIAAKEQHYAGIRFQQDLSGNQYMVFIVHDFDKTGLANGFRAVEGIKPIKLPDSVGVMDLNLGSTDQVINDDGYINDPNEIRDTTTFSIIFSPSGKMVIHDVRVRNRDGETDGSSDESYDDVFNKDEKVDVGEAMFYQDDYSDLGLDEESSRSSFVIYEKEKFRQAYDKVPSQAWSDYLSKLKAIHINPYTGTIISAD